MDVWKRESVKVWKYGSMESWSRGNEAAVWERAPEEFKGHGLLHHIRHHHLRYIIPMRYTASHNLERGVITTRSELITLD
jgi:hypothetical protein